MLRPHQKCALMKPVYSSRIHVVPIKPLLHSYALKNMMLVLTKTMLKGTKRSDTPVHFCTKLHGKNLLSHLS